MKTPGKFCADNWFLPGGALGKAIAARDVEWQSHLAASETALRVAVEHARDVQARLDEATAFVRRVAKMGATVIQPTRLELDAIALVKWWDSGKPASVESPASHRHTSDCDRCAECGSCRIDHDTASGHCEGFEDPCECDELAEFRCDLCREEMCLNCAGKHEAKCSALNQTSVEPPVVANADPDVCALAFCGHRRSGHIDGLACCYEDRATDNKWCPCGFFVEPAPAVKEESVAAGDRCAKPECRGLRVFHDANTHKFVEPMPAGNAGARADRIAQVRQSIHGGPIDMADYPEPTTHEYIPCGDDECNCCGHEIAGEMCGRGQDEAVHVAPAPERDPCAACQGHGGFTSHGNPEPEWRALGPDHACGRCGGTGVAKC